MSQNFRESSAVPPSGHAAQGGVETPPPIIVRRTSIPALKPAGEIGDGWYGVEMSVEECREKILRIKKYVTAAGRDPDVFSATIAQDMAAPVELDSEVGS